MQVGDIIWADYELGKYLNNDFYNKFNKTDQIKIISVINKKQDN